MALFLQSETGTDGEAVWGAAPSGGGDTLLLIVAIEGAGTVAAPAIDPEGLRNIVYDIGDGVETATVVLPAITADLSPTWRITIAGTDVQYVSITADAGDTIVNISGLTVLLTGYGEGQVGGSATFVHDGTSSWALFAGVASSPA